MTWLSGPKRESKAAPRAAAAPDVAAAPRESDTEADVAAAVCRTGDKARALEWLQRLHGEEHLARVAVEGGYAELRFAAAQRLTADMHLERVAAGTREHDKRVHRHCTELLRARKASAGRAGRAEQLAASLAALADEPPPLVLARLSPLEREVQALGDCAEAVPCRAWLEQFYARMRAEGETLRQLHRAAERSDALAAGIARASWPLTGRIDGWNRELAALKDIVAGLPAWTQSAATAHTLRATLDATAARIGEIADDIERHAACERFLDALDGPGDPAAWEALPRPRHAAARGALEARWAQHVEQVRAVLAAATAAARPKPAPALDLGVVQKALFAFEQALAQGQFAEAERFDTKIEKLLGAGHAPRGIDARWKRARAELVRLRGWARWGTTQAHDQLIAEAELTFAAPMDVEALAKAVAKFREAWKRLDATGPAPRAQWERFDALMEKAYRPVAEHRAAQAAKNRELRTARDALLAQWEAWIAALDWTQADWRAVERKRAEILGAWHAGTRCAPRDERALGKRFDPLIAQLETRLKAARAGEAARRQALIDRAEALREAGELGAAMSEARTLQAQWRDEAGSVYLGRRRDEELWKRFRAACDAIYARRDAQKAERAAEAERLAEARRAVERKVQEKNDQRAARYTTLADKAALAQRVEEAAASGADAARALVEARAAWAALPVLAAEAERALAKRLEAAGSATNELLARGLALRAEMLLDLELTLELPSPADQAEARRARQIRRLKERFSGGGGDEGAEQKVIRWHAIAAAADAGLEARMAVVARTLVEKELRSASGKIDPRRRR